MKKTLKLYKVTTRLNAGKYNCFFVVSTNPTKAYAVVRKMLDDKEIGVPANREMQSIEVLAEASHYTAYDVELLFDNESINELGGRNVSENKN